MKLHLTSDVFCSIYGHNYFKLKKPTASGAQLVCKCCKKYFTYDETGEIVELQLPKQVA